MFFIDVEQEKLISPSSTDKYDRAIYVSRFFMSFVVLCLLLVEHQRLGAFSLLGLEVGFCLLQGKKKIHRGRRKKYRTGLANDVCQSNAVAFNVFA